MKTAHRQRRWSTFTQVGIPILIISAILLVFFDPALFVPVITPTEHDPLVHAQNHAIAPFDPRSATYRENQRAGTTAWELDQGANLAFIQGYLDRVSALPGARVGVYVSSLKPVTYRLDVYRIGWYDGKGGRLYLTQANLHSPAQGIWGLNIGLVGCATCTRDPKTDLVEPHWQASYSLTVGKDWLSGVYLLKVTAANGAETYMPLVVRAAHSASVALVNLPVNTYQAYNLWGGYSLYAHYDKGVLPGKAVKVTFDRPYDRGAGTADFLNWDIQSVRWLERYGLDATYTTDVDVSEQPQELLHHRLYLDLGHDEYWTKTMRDGVEAARDRGVSLAFMGANDSYWQARMEPDAEHNADRTLVCYKVASEPRNPSEQLKNDPMYPHHPEIVTAMWADPVLHRPEQQLLGLYYAGSFALGDYYPAWVVARAGDPLLSGTALQPGDKVWGILGYEFDGMHSRQNTMPGLHILAQSPVIDRYGHTHIAATAYYRAPSGAFVFDAGTIWWSWGLDGFTARGATRFNKFRGSADISTLMANIINAMRAATPSAPAGETAGG
jgi:hypothetical protein